jgi:hypothetical protein
MTPEKKAELIDRLDSLQINHSIWDAIYGMSEVVKQVIQEL